MSVRSAAKHATSHSRNAFVHNPEVSGFELVLIAAAHAQQQLVHRVLSNFMLFEIALMVEIEKNVDDNSS